MVMNRAVFFDRDGVINSNVYYPDTKEWESPRTVKEFSVFPQVFKALRILSEQNYRLFLISNQPSYAKGKTTLEDLNGIHEKLVASLKENAVQFCDFYYCYHHPEAVVAAYKKLCECRKPSPFFIREAQKKYRIDLELSWMFGDRATDIECGRTAGVRTVLIKYKNSLVNCAADLVAEDLNEAVGMILSRDNAHRVKGAKTKI